MNQRNVDDASIHTAVRSATTESSLRELTRNWNSASFVEAFRVIETESASAEKEAKSALFRALYRERSADENIAALEFANKNRHTELVGRLDALKLPRWFHDRNFIVTLFILGITALGTGIAIYALFKK